MKARYILLLLPAITFTALLPSENCSAKNVNNYRSNENGYTLEIPNRWEQIPDKIIHEYIRLLASEEGQSTIFFETAFQRKAKEGLWFQSPYAIVQILKYSDFFLNRQPKENELEFLVKQMSGINTVKAADEVLNPVARGLVIDPKIGEVYYDSDNKLYTFSIEIKQPNDDNLMGQIVGYFGRSAIVQVMFYDIKSNWIQSEADRKLILGSFYFDPAFKYVPIDSSLVTSKRIETKADKSAFRRLLEAFVGGAGASLIIAFVIIVGLFLKGFLFSKGEEDSSSDSER